MEWSRLQRTKNDSKYVSIKRIDLTMKLQEKIISNLKIKNIFSLLDEYNERVCESLDNIKTKSL